MLTVLLVAVLLVVAGMMTSMSYYACSRRSLDADLASSVLSALDDVARAGHATADASHASSALQNKIELLLNRLESDSTAIQRQAAVTAKLSTKSDTQIVARDSSNRQYLSSRRGIKWPTVCPLKDPNSKEMKKSQVGQDIDTYEKYFKNLFGTNKPLCGGTFVDIGAHDGFKISNSYFFERALGWHGLCIDANPDTFVWLTRNRPACMNINTAVGDFPTGSVMPFVKAGVFGGFRSTVDERRAKMWLNDRNLTIEKQTVDVPVWRTQDLLDANRMDYVDFMSIDVEGAELGVVQTIDFSRTHISIISMEENTGQDERSGKNWRVRQHLARNGFICAEKTSFDVTFVNIAWAEAHDLRVRDACPPVHKPER